MRFGIFATAAIAALSTSVEAVKELQKFKIQTKVLEGDKKFDGLWAVLYHTGAASADVTFTADKSRGFKAFINQTALQWVYNGVEYIPYSLNLRYQTYSQWGPVEVTPGYGEEYYGKGYKFSGRDKIVTDNEEWEGWLVCDWWHGVPELFWVQTGLELKLIKSCAKVNLVAKTNI